MTSEEATTILRTDAVAQELLRSTIPSRLAYVWRDERPRVVPMWFHWTGEEFLMGAPPNAPKMKVLADHPSVAFTIDGNEWPYPVLSVRGLAFLRLVDHSARPLRHNLLRILVQRARLRDRLDALLHLRISFQ